jgi:excisionase family DNA binding protein
VRAVRPAAEDTTVDWSGLPVLMTSLELAEFLNVPEQTVRRWRSNGTDYGPPFVRLGRAVKYSRDDIRRWFRNLSKGRDLNVA